MASEPVNFRIAARARRAAAGRARTSTLTGRRGRVPGRPGAADSPVLGRTRVLRPGPRQRWPHRAGPDAAPGYAGAPRLPWQARGTGTN